MNQTIGIDNLDSERFKDQVINFFHNVTTHPEWKELLNNTSTILMTCNLVLLMLGMGAATSIIEVWDNVKRPWGCIVGMICQFGLLPAFGFCTCQFLNLPPYQSLGVIILTCSPGGAFSNFFAYWMGGDVAISLIMTASSCLLAFGAMPLNLWIYSRFWTNEKLVIPYVNVVISMAFATGPALIGTGIRHVTRKWANRLAKICGLLGWLGAITSGVLLAMVYWEDVERTSFNMIVAAGAVPAFGFISSYLLAKIFCMSHKQCRTIGIEVSCQNMVVALNVVLLSFPDPEVKGQMIVYPAVYGLFQIAEIFIAVIIYQIYKFIHRDDVIEEDIKSVVDNSILRRVQLPDHTRFNSVMEQSDREYEIMRQRSINREEHHDLHWKPPYSYLSRKESSAAAHFIKSLHSRSHFQEDDHEKQFLSISQQSTLQLPRPNPTPRLILTEHPVPGHNNVYSSVPQTPRSPSSNFGYAFNTFLPRGKNE